MGNLSHYQRVTIAVCLCSIITFGNIYWLQPLLPLLQQQFDLSSMMANFAMSMPLLGMGCGLLMFASLSDSLGRYKILLVGIAAGLFISLCLPFCADYRLFLALRFLQGFFFAVCPAVAIPLLGDELRKNWLPAAVGFYIAANTVGGLSSRLIAGAGAKLWNSWEMVALIIGLSCVLLFVIAYMLLPRQRHFKPKHFELGSALTGFAQHLKQPPLLVIYLIIGMAFACFVNISNYLMLVLEADYNLPSDLRSLLFLTLLGGTFSSSFAGKYAKRHHLLSGVIIGLVIMLVGNVFLLQQSLPLIVVAMILLSIGFFFCHAQASALVGRSVRKNKASAQALYSLFYYSGASLGVVFLEPFYQDYGWHGVVVSTTVILLVCVSLAVLDYAFSHKPQSMTAAAT